jgi:hypothetical protein
VQKKIILLFLGSIAILAAGCRAEPLSPQEFKSRLTQLGSERKKLSSLVCSYDLIVAGRKPDGRKGRLSCSGRIAGAPGQGLRMRGAKALGMAKIFDITVKTDNYRLHFIHGKKFFTGSVSQMLTKKKVSSLLGKNGLELEALLFPIPNQQDCQESEMLFGHRKVLMTWRNQAGQIIRRLILDAATVRPLFTEIFTGGGRRKVLITYLKPVEVEGLHPVKGFRIRGSGRTRFRLDVKLGKIRINAKLSKRAFELAPPPGMKIIDADKPEEKPSVTGKEASK